MQKDPKPDVHQQREAVEANIKLNEEMNSVYRLHSDHIDSPTEANMKLDEEFYGDDGQTNFEPTFLYNNTPPIQINRED